MLEEFGLSYRFFGEEERKVVFAVVADAVIAAKRAGRPLMGAMFWNAAYGGKRQKPAAEHGLIPITKIALQGDQLACLYA